MIKTTIKHYLYDLGLSVLFDSLYKNLIIPTISPIIEGKNITIEIPNYTIILYEVSGDINQCIHIGGQVISELMFMDMSIVVEYIKNKYDIDCAIIPK